ncbi:DNA photolyase family protein [Hyphomonadaceae bacterium ML37]|nr:DNA photolyase family protein [Hyphomonadaceae bacterium ML37]
MGAQLVWFKRDLRAHDHAGLAAAASSGGPVLCLYIVEPWLWAQPDYSGRHYAFLTETLADLDRALRARGGTLTVRTGEAVAVLDALHRQTPIDAIHAHEETGLIATWERDRAVAQWARRHSIAFIEHRQNGVIRALPSRNGWAKRWEAFMSQPVIPAPARFQDAGAPSEPIPAPEALGLAPDPCPGRQTGGRRQAVADLESFLFARGRDYRRAMSSPVSAFDACSRLSAHLALGAISVREAYQGAGRALTAHRAAGEVGFARSVESFISRLHWHCHFMQKFEDEPELATRDLHPAYRGARPEADPDTLKRWIEGRTGLPFLDACMRALDHTGWLNFRMRAMAAAFSSYHLWQDWKRPAQALARRFTDFEPGIHYPQFQMQSGVTGVNTPRIYNPVKQSMDQDPDGVFIARWVPELAALPAPFRHQPWTAPQGVLEAAGVQLGVTYTDRIVDHEQAAREAKAKLTALRRSAGHGPASDAIQARHGSRKSGLKQTGSATRRRKAKAAPDPAQGSLF